MRIPIIQELINILRFKILDMDIMIRKKISVEKNIDNIHTLILGSSHAKCSYRPEKGEYNLGLSSQDLYYSYNLLKQYDNKNIQNIIISFSVFSPGHQLIKTSGYIKCLLYKILFNIDYQYPGYAKSKYLYLREPLYKYIIKHYEKNVKVSNDYLGEEIEYFVPKKNLKSDYTERYAIGNLKNNKRDNEQINYVDKIIDYAKERNQTVIFFISPHSDDYRKVLSDKSSLFKQLYERCSGKSNVKILDFYDDNRFLKEDFLDGDHLNLKGSEKLTALIKAAL